MSSENLAYALANPLAVVLNKPPRDFQRADFLRVIKENRLERITFHFAALDGKLKEFKLPVSSDARVEHILAEGERVDGSSLFKGMSETSLSDLYVVPEYKTAFLNPFDEGSLDFICRYVTEDGKRAPFALDTILAKANQLLVNKAAVELYTLGELEFFLLREKESDLFPIQKQRGYQESSPFIKSGRILSEMSSLLTKMTGAVNYARSENGSIDSVRSELDEIKGKRAEQLEIEFLPRPIEEMADALVLGRWLIRNVAYRHGCVATFTPKLEEGVAGNGLHLHLQLRKGERNHTVDDAGNLSDGAHRLIGGLCEYVDSLTAFGNTVASSYLRLIPGVEAPMRVFWSRLDRKASIRVPLGWSKLHHLAGAINPQAAADSKRPESPQTVEFRSPDGSAIVHLLLAGIAMAVEWGMTHSSSLEIAQKLRSDASEPMGRKFLESAPVLPASCADSARILTKRRDLYERDGVFPPAVIDYCVRLLQEEDDGQLSKKLADMHQNDRLREMRKIMHRDLHRH